MSVVYEAVVFEGDAGEARQAVERLRTPLALRLFRVADRGFALVCWRPGAATRHATREVDRLAAVLSEEFGAALAVHHDDRGGVESAELFRAGSPAPEVEAEDDNGYLIPVGPRYPAGVLPAGVACVCVREGIDAGLEEAGFAHWLTAAELREWACSDDRWLAERPG
jgi:hypothetical protein